MNTEPAADPLPDSPLPPDAGQANMRGFAFALTAYGLWGVLPLFLRELSHVPPAEVVAHRILWSLPVAGAVLVFLGRTADIKAALGSPRTLAMAAVTAAIISLNWGIYIWAIAVDRAIETALGYYINPLMMLALGAAVLGEKLGRMQLVAVALAVAAVTLLTIQSGGLPWVSLCLAISFTIYGFLRKTLPIGPSQGFFLEVLILSVPALFYVCWLGAKGTGHFSASQPIDMLLLIASGPVTAVPLLCYGFGAKLLKFSTLGVMQYITPTMIFLIAVFIFREPFGIATMTAFVLIWAALAIYSSSIFSGRSPMAGLPKAPD